MADSEFGFVFLFVQHTFSVRIFFLLLELLRKCLQHVSLFPAQFDNHSNYSIFSCAQRIYQVSFCQHQRKMLLKLYIIHIPYTPHNTLYKLQFSFGSLDEFADGTEPRTSGPDTIIQDLTQQDGVFVQDWYLMRIAFCVGTSLG